MKKFYSSLILLIALLPFTTFAEQQAKEDNPVLVTVNGVAITASEFQHFVSRLAQRTTAEDAIREMINIELINQAARDDKFMQDPELQMEIKRVTSALIAQTYLQNHLSSLEITDEQLQDRYDSKYQQAEKASEYNANHILVKTEEEARDVIKQLDEGGNFEELAKQLSTGPSGKNGGALGWFKQQDMVAPFSQATMQLEKGQYSESPVQTQFGWHVIQLNDVRSSEPPALDTVREDLRKSIASESIRDVLQKLYNEATIEFATR